MAQATLIFAEEQAALDNEKGNKHIAQTKSHFLKNKLAIE